ncbi:ABC transporter permease [Rhodococcus jostii]|uniref:Monosaccharide ABC transporter membrane protein, CUT2 family n=1 Tax=Rhodococcus jostii TaxID=132919 RepID=A0A1H4IK70_RHOJO|nr:ABC transporter permease [Rhodococcus jostii]SEB34514.1 monosaccharide ABC transporter membrane protein, CUT2 family [Rhodococcus jostii]
MSQHTDSEPPITEQLSQTNPTSRRPQVLGVVARAASRNTGVLAGLAVLSIFMTLTQPVFLTWGNITNIVGANSVVLVLAIGATFVIISAGIDLSAASAAALAGMSFGVFLNLGWGATSAVSGTLLVGLVLGLINGVLIAYARVPFLVVTLGTLSIFGSLALVLKQGQTINTFSLPGFQPVYRFVSGEVAGITYLLIFDMLVVSCAAFTLRYTSFGRAVFAVGSNAEAAHLNGINIARTVLSIYVLAGMFAALASLIQVGRLTGASPNIDANLLLTVIAAVLIGGTAYSGGEGGVGGTVLGVLFLGVIQNALTLSDVSTFWRGTVNGLVLIAAVTLGVARQHGWFAKLRPAAIG